MTMSVRLDAPSSPDVAALVTGWSGSHPHSCELGFDEVDGSLHGSRLQPSHSAAVRTVEEDEQQHQESDDHGHAPHEHRLGRGALTRVGETEDVDENDAADQE